MQNLTPSGHGTRARHAMPSPCDGDRWEPAGAFLRSRLWHPEFFAGSFGVVGREELLLRAHGTGRHYSGTDT